MKYGFKRSLYSFENNGSDTQTYLSSTKVDMHCMQMDAVIESGGVSRDHALSLVKAMKR